jgi:hypothetical protein
VFSRVFANRVRESSIAVCLWPVICPNGFTRFTRSCCLFSVTVPVGAYVRQSHGHRAFYIRTLIIREIARIQSITSSFSCPKWFLSKRLAAVLFHLDPCLVRKRVFPISLTYGHVLARAIFHASAFALTPIVLPSYYACSISIFHFCLNDCCGLGGSLLTWGYCYSCAIIAIR